MKPDPYDLARFVEAQAPLFLTVLAELRAGRKRSHWMWFVFPQLRGLGRSPMAHRFGIASLDEARAYLAHEILGARLIECTETVNELEGLLLHDIFGSPDDAKFHSCMTLFSLVANERSGCFKRGLDRYCRGLADHRTLGDTESRCSESL